MSLRQKRSGTKTKPLKFGKFDVFYKIADFTLHSGDILRGSVELHLHRPVFVTAITVTFYGEITFEIFSTNFKNKHLQSRKFATKVHKIFEKPSHETAMVLENGFYIYEFFVSTEANLPVSFVGNGSVRSLVYFCEAVIVEVLQQQQQQDQHEVHVEHTKRKPFLIKLPPPLNGSIPGKSVWAQKNVMYVKNILDASGVVAACVVLYKRHYRVGENVRFKVEILNCFRRLTVDVSFVQHGKIFINGTYKLIDLELVRMNIGEMKSSQCYKSFNDRTFWIPDESMAPTSLRLMYADHLIRVWYTFLLTVKTWNDQKLLVELPMIVKNNSKSVQNYSSNGRLRSVCGTI